MLASRLADELEHVYDWGDLIRIASEREIGSKDSKSTGVLRGTALVACF